MAAIACAFLGSVDTPLSSTIWPRNFTLRWRKWYFFCCKHLSAEHRIETPQSLINEWASLTVLEFSHDNPHKLSNHHSSFIRVPGVMPTHWKNFRQEQNQLPHHHLTCFCKKQPLILLNYAEKLYLPITLNSTWINVYVTSGNHLNWARGGWKKTTRISITHALAVHLGIQIFHLNATCLSFGLVILTGTHPSPDIVATSFPTMIFLCVWELWVSMSTALSATTDEFDGSLPDTRCSWCGSNITACVRNHTPLPSINSR